MSDEHEAVGPVLPERAVLTNEQWAVLEPLLPPQKPRTGKPNKAHRLVVEGMLWVLRMGAPWRDLPAAYGPYSTVANRSYHWLQAGVWEWVLAGLHAAGDARGELNWLLHISGRHRGPGAPARHWGQKGALPPSRRRRPARRSAARVAA